VGVVERKRILVCGGAGFIGRNICSYFGSDSSYEVYATCRQDPDELDRKVSSVKYLQADLTNKDDVHRVVQGMDVVLQAAATTSGAKDIVNAPYLHVTDNAIMNALLFRACHEFAVSRVVFLSCTVMYSEQPEPVKEEDFIGEIHGKYFAGGWTKVYHEKMCEFYSQLGATKYTVLRHSNIYGPYDKFDLERSHVFGATMTKVLTAEDGKIVVWGDGTDERDFLYVEDLMECIRLTLEKQTMPFDLLNVGFGQSVSIRELVQKIIRVSGRDLTVEFDLTKPTIGFKLNLNINKVKSRYAWAPVTSLDDGILKTLKWYSDNVFKISLSGSA